jgi:predicted dehydrogenase
VSHGPVRDARLSEAGTVDDGSVGVGIIGMGFMGRTHLGAYAAAEGARVRALFDPSMRAATAGNLITAGDGVDALLASVPRAASVEELLGRPDIDLVSICTPTDRHVALVRAAIAAGKHVLVEKPTALDPREIDALAAEADAAGVLVMPAHCMRFWPAWSWMAEAVRSGRFGAARRASFRRMGAKPSWSQDFYLDLQRSGGALVDLHIHDADFVRFAFGEPESVQARGSRMHVVARYLYADGLVVEAEGGWMDDPDFAFTMTATIECERATIDFQLGREPELMVRVPASGSTPGTTREASQDTHAVRAGSDYPTGTGYDHEVRALLRAIASRSPKAPVTLADAAATQRLLDREAAELSRH